MPDRNVVIKDLRAGFVKSEILMVAKELGLKKVSAELNTKAIIELILNDIDENGVPEPKDSSDMMIEFLTSAEILDSDGNIINEVESEPEQEDILPDKLPECFGFVDLRDPASKICSVQSHCMKRRTSNRPPCFGLLFDKNDANCQECLEALACRPATAEKQVQPIMKKR